MSMNVKATERLIKVGGDGIKGTYRFVMQAQLYNRLTADKVIEEASKHSGMSDGVLESAWKAIGDVITAWATEGRRWSGGPGGVPQADSGLRLGLSTLRELLA